MEIDKQKPNRKNTNSQNTSLMREMQIKITRHHFILQRITHIKKEQNQTAFA